ncbi:sugar phosphate isomerase/epimerase [Dyadobacter sp. CY323]|uniref:sugar phosphate isomerase/epimerase family protein n=1 Tax=Dyadobacter sp. CY323 TaxID=2907302 RepID=UPI001F3A8399|nr:sugar phosphate isomerase/epimerase family protein [Dyadobacter sp. CY323]MCE6992470.1 sugar phosphate isomerase/epimerase [Dyadobacter sp. CY323]
MALAAVTALDLPLKKRTNQLAFSTLGCPKWELSQILETAVSQGYQAIEIRGLRGEMYLPNCPEFSSPEQIAKTRKQFADRNIKICNLGASTALHYLDPEKRQKNLDEAKRFIHLAQQLSCPYVRVFPNNLPKDQDREKTIDAITAGLLELGRYAEKAKVTVLLESHGEVVGKDLLLRIMKQAEHPNVGLIWDIFNMWSVTKEPPKEVYATLKKYIRHTHIKDGKLVDGKIQYTFLGQGDAPLTEAFDVLESNGYKGYYSFEWEKMWHPEIAEPELAFVDYPVSIKKYLKPVR